MTNETTLWKGDMQVGTLTEIVENRIGATARLQIEESASELMRDYIQYDISLQKGEQEIPWNEMFRTVIDSGDWKVRCSTSEEEVILWPSFFRDGSIRWTRLRSMSLYFDGTLIGTIEDAFFNNQQWYGTFEFVSDNFMSAIANRAKEYIEFCQDWNEACERDDPLPHSLFDSYKDMTESDKWMVIDDDCESTRILCPNLFGEEISCIPFDRE